MTQSSATQLGGEQPAKKDAIRPFRANVSESDVADLRKRLASTRWPTKELVSDRSQGVQLATLQELTRYWTTEYDWRKCEARLSLLQRGRQGRPLRGMGRTGTLRVGAARGVQAVALTHRQAS